MSLALVSMPYCCTAGVIAGFGGSSTAAISGPEYWNDPEKLYEGIKPIIEDAHRKGWGILFATTTGQQTVANQVLERIGFQRSEDTAKANHREYPLIGWMFRLNSDEVRPLKVPANPFGKKKAEGVSGATAQTMTFDEAGLIAGGLRALQEDVGMRPGDQLVINAGRDPRRLPPQAVRWDAPVNLAQVGEDIRRDVIRPAPAPAVSVHDESLDLPGQVALSAWQQTTVNHVGTLLAPHERMRVRTVRVSIGGVVEVMAQIHSDDVGRKVPLHVRAGRQVSPILSGSRNQFQPAQARDRWTWTGLGGVGGDVEPGAITHYKVM